jgi:hypothetical protein
MVHRSLSLEDADAIRRAKGTRNPNGTKITIAQLAEDYQISAVTVSNVLHFQGVYSDDPIPEPPETAAITIGRFLIWLTKTMQEDGDIKTSDIGFKTRYLTLRDARKIQVIFNRVLETLDTKPSNLK